MRYIREPCRKEQKVSMNHTAINLYIEYTLRGKKIVRCVAENVSDSLQQVITAGRFIATNSVDLIIIIILTAIGLSSGGSGYFTCIQNIKLVTNKFKSGGLHEKHVVATWNVGNRLSVCL